MKTKGQLIHYYQGQIKKMSGKLGSGQIKTWKHKIKVLRKLIKAEKSEKDSKK